MEYRKKNKKISKKGLSYEQQLEIAKKAGGDKITPTVIVMIIVEVVLVAFLTIGANWIITTIENAKGGNTNNYYVATEQNNINNYNNNITAERSIIGTWYDREKKTTLILNSDQTAELYTDDKTLIYIKGTYTLEQDMTNQIGDEYIITITTSNRTLEGQLYTESYTTKFSAVTENYQAMVMMNIITYNMYNFERIK